MSVPALSTTDTAASLTALMRNFDRDGVTSRRLIDELLQAAPEVFREAAVQVLKNADDSRAVQCLIGVLVAHGMLLSVLCHPALSREQVMVVARIAQRVDSTAESAIAKGLADSVISNDPGVRPKDAGRLLEVLSEISDGNRILPSLLRLLRHPDPHLRSKAVKMIGSGTRSAKWVQGRLAETDPRVRANAIESLWGLDSPEARELLQASVRDGDNRVAGNALVALHRIGDSGVIPDYFRMAAHDSQRFRVTAAWAMGEAADPRFSETLARLLRDTHPPVRTRALAGLGRIKTFLAKTRQTSPWYMASMLQDNPQRNLRRLQLLMATEDGGEYPLALGTQFLLSEDGQPVIAYRTSEWQAPRPMSVVFVFPRGREPSADAWVRGALSCRTWKRRSDFWGLESYIPPGGAGGVGGADRPAEDPARLTASLETIEETFTQPPEDARCGGFWNTLMQAILSEYGGSFGQRQVIVFNHSAAVAAPPEELTPAVVTGAKVRVQVVSTVPNQVLEDFCRVAGGVFRLAGSPGEVDDLILRCYLDLLTPYEIAYTPVCPAARTVRVRVQTAEGWGEASFPVTDEALARWLVAERP
jgi:hypothetical protein